MIKRSGLPRGCTYETEHQDQRPDAARGLGTLWFTDRCILQLDGRLRQCQG
jgi:hypothetical protein